MSERAQPIGADDIDRDVYFAVRKALHERITQECDEIKKLTEAMAMVDMGVAFLAVTSTLALTKMSRQSLHHAIDRIWSEAELRVANEVINMALQDTICGPNGAM